ncbi:ABC transporter substrate-binding protein [Mycolicibacterium litorale]|uniref:ABC transporter substrate-binding protein n=1 Tax=Mycolicibacterium litorale TaxID=758802 RepID=UPI003CF20E6E
MTVRTTLFTLVSSAALVAGCSSAPAETAAGQANATGFPVTVDNCGETVTIERPPTRAVGYFQQSTEIMLALGLQDSVVGSVFPDNPPLPEYAEAYNAIPEISNKDASFEQLLAVQPDFVYGGYRSAFAESEGRARTAFAAAGITTYLSPEACSTGPVRMADVYAEVERIATVFGVPERAEAVVDAMQRSVADARGDLEDVPPLKVFVYDSGEDAAFTAGAKGIGTQVVEIAGGTNIFDDLDDVFGDVSWEQVIERDPDVIVVYDYFGAPGVENKKEFLRSRPELANVSAIKNDRFADLTLQDTVMGVRAPYAVAKLAAQLHPDRFR